MAGAPLATSAEAVRPLAAWLLQHEADDAEDPEAFLAAAERASQKLCTRLAKLVTMAGCQSLLERAIHLAAAEAPVLHNVRAGILPGKCLQGLAESAHGAPAEQMQAALVAVVTHLLGLLTQFIGAPMTARLVHDVWPEAPLSPGGTDPTPQEALQ